LNKEEVTMNDIVLTADRSWGVPWFGISFLLLLVIIGGTAIYLARRRPAPPDGGHRSRPGAEEVLAARFARGDIDEEEYLARLSTLRGREPGA
jgi:putative membrane protein